MRAMGTVSILNSGALLLSVNGEYNQFETHDELEIYAFKNKITLKPKTGDGNEQGITD